MKKFLLISIIFLLSVLVYGFFIKKEEEIKIGFVGALTAKYSVLGNAMMNGILLAFEEENFRINDKKVKLIFEDDKRDPEVNIKIIKNYIEQGVKIVIGNVTSSMSKVSMSIINNYDDMFMISAASASNEFSGKDDRFFRVHVANNAQRFNSFTKYIQERGFKKIYGIYDPDNITYTKDYLENFEKNWIEKGEKSFVKYEKSNIDLEVLVNDIKTLDTDLILICANSVDVAKIVQYLRTHGIDKEIASSEWALTNTFIENSGKYSENIIFNIDFDENSQNEKFLQFVKNYELKYNTKPSMFASKGYELAKIIIELLKVGKETELKENLLKIRKFEGLQDTIVFDKYGDVVRTFYTFRVKNGKFVKVK